MYEPVEAAPPLLPGAARLEWKEEEEGGQEGSGLEEEAEEGGRKGLGRGGVVFCLRFFALDGDDDGIMRRKALERGVSGGLLRSPAEKAAREENVAGGEESRLGSMCASGESPSASSSSAMTMAS